MRFYPICLAAAMLACGCRSDDYRSQVDLIASIATNSPADFAAGRELLRELAARGGRREPLLRRPHTFIRSQTKYSGRLYRDYYNWHLRPLFASRLLWDPDGSDHKLTSFRRTFELYQTYGVDGFATFAWPQPAERVIAVVYDTASRMRLDPARFSLMLEVTSDDAYADIHDDKFGLIVTNAYAFRVNGKSVISSYTMDRWPPGRIARHVADYRRRSGDRTLFLPQMGFISFTDADNRPLNIHAIYDVYRAKGTLPATLLLRMMDYLRAYARVCDGLYLGHQASAADTTLDDRFSDEILFPLFTAVLAEPEFAGRKLFAAVAKVGYTSYHGSQHVSRDGTKTLRKCLDLADRHRADLIICPEWDELNEDTGFQPQVSCPMSTQRIMKYYTDRFKGVAPSPNPGDDAAIPNLIVSQRRQLTPGWTHDIELLHVPDTAQGEPYSVRLEVLDERGRVVHRAEPESFDTAVLKAKTYRLPSEAFAECQALCTRLTVTVRGATQVFEEGLPFTVLRSTTCWDQTYANTPLRNVLKPERVQVAFRDPVRDLAPGIGRVTVQTDLVSSGQLAAVEVVQDSLEVYAWDPRDEFLQTDASRKLFKLSWHYVNDPCQRQIKFSVGLTNAPSALTFNVPDPNRKAEAGPAFTQNLVVGMGRWNGAGYTGRVDHWPKARLISLATADVARAVLALAGSDLTNAAASFAWALPFNELGDYGVISKVFDNGLMFALETFHRPLDNPLPPGTNTASFSRVLAVDNPNGVLAVRAVSEDGKVFWSRPYAFNQKPSDVQVTVPVYANSTGRFVEVSMASNRVPVIAYDFTPRWGHILHTAAGREFYGHAGSYLATAIGFVGLESANYSIPFPQYSQGIFKGADRPAPAWVQDETGRWVLAFDGERGNFLALPATFMPQRAGFTLAFEIRPETTKPEYVLFHHGAVTFGGLTVGVKGGKLTLAYTRRTPDDPALPTWSRLEFKTGLSLLPDQWQEVMITRDGSQLTAGVDGRTERFPCEGIGLYLQPSHFGGRGDRLRDGTVPFFKGQLRALSIRHSVGESRR